MAMNPEQGMERDPRLSAEYRAAARELPPPRLDAAIRAAARRGAADGPRRRPVLARWRLPLSLAAVVVLSVSLVLVMRQEGVDRLDAPVSASEPPAVPLPEAAQEIRKQIPKAAAQEGARPASPFAAQAPAVPPPVERREAEPPAAAVRDEAVPAMVPPPPPAPAPPQTLRPMLRSAPAPARSAESPGSPGQSAAMSAPPPWQDLAGQPAEQWIRRIADLRQAGRMAEADAVAAEFHRRFPEQQLP